ncbi:MAG: peroxide stress protein YaaA [Actinomycetota bacterium]|nr:peroxide stress protein YaaA [Actinomycetota bacterium]
MLILLPPSEGKRAPRRGNRLRPERWPATLAAPRQQILTALVSLCEDDPEQAAKVLGLGPGQADEVRRNARLLTAPTARADGIYTGVLYEALDVAGLSPPARGRATRWLAIVSSLFGLVRPGEPIPAYRLSGNTTLPGIGSVAGHWRGHLDLVVRDALGKGLLVDLRSSTYSAFWRPAPDLAPRVAGVRVLHEVDGTRQVVSHFNKATKGRLVRALLEDGASPRTPSALASHLSALGWTVETGEPTAKGARLDVVVSGI